jgi:hypothetical protein
MLLISLNLCEIYLFEFIFWKGCKVHQTFGGGAQAIEPIWGGAQAMEPLIQNMSTNQGQWLALPRLIISK